MKNRRIVVIGGSSGIGLESCEILRDRGADVIAVSRTDNEQLKEKKIHHIKADVLKDDLTTLPLPDEIDGVIYCPGSINLKPFHALKISDFRDDMEINLIGAVHVLQALLSRLKRGNDPSVVLFSTVAVQQGMNFHASIAAAKGAIEGLTRSLAAEWAPKIRVNCIAPSLTDTPLAGRLLSTEDKKQAAADRHPMKKIGTPRDIATMAAFLSDPDTAWVTGQVLGVDGGLSSLKV